jgi:hypothetical protein
VRWQPVAGGILALAMAGCSLGADEEPQPASGVPRAVAATVTELERATARGDWAAICNDILTREARRRAGGPDCARLTRSSAEGVRRPRIEVLGIELRGDAAEVRVRTRASGQAPVEDVLRLRRQGGEWRVDALAG